MHLGAVLVPVFLEPLLVYRKRLREHHRQVDRPALRGPRHWDGGHRGAVGLHKLNAEAHRGLDLGVDTFEEVVLRHADADAVEPAIDGRGVVGRRLPRRCRVERVVSGERGHHDGRVCDTPGHGADVVARPAQVEDADSADDAVGRLQARDSAHGRRHPYRPAGIAAQRAIDEAAAHCGA